MDDAQAQCPRCGGPAAEVPLRVRFESERTARALRCDPCGGVQRVCLRCGVAMAEDAAVITDDSSGKPHAGSRCPKCRARALRCPRCASPMFESDKNTFTGRELRTFWCGLCGEMLDVDTGIALWTAMSGGSTGKAPSPRPHRLAILGWLFVGLAAVNLLLAGIGFFTMDLDLDRGLARRALDVFGGFHGFLGCGEVAVGVAWTTALLGAAGALLILSSRYTPGRFPLKR